jgi:hypothetical protein
MVFSGGTDGEIPSSRAGVTQLAECLLPKQNVAGSNPVSRSTSPLGWRLGSTAESTGSGHTLTSVAGWCADAPQNVAARGASRPGAA